MWDDLKRGDPADEWDDGTGFYDEAGPGYWDAWIGVVIAVGFAVLLWSCGYF